MQARRFFLLAVALFTSFIPVLAQIDFVPEPVSVQYVSGQEPFILDKNVRIG